MFVFTKLLMNYNLVRSHNIFSQTPHCFQRRGGEAAGEQGYRHWGEALLRAVHGGGDQGREAVQTDGQRRGWIRHQKRQYFTPPPSQLILLILIQFKERFWICSSAYYKLKEFLFLGVQRSLQKSQQGPGALKRYGMLCQNENVFRSRQPSGSSTRPGTTSWIWKSSVIWWVKGQTQQRKNLKLWTKLLKISDDHPSSLLLLLKSREHINLGFLSPSSE